MTSNIPRTMKAWQFSSASPTIEANLKLNTNAPLPDGAHNLKPDQVLVQVLVTSLNPVDFKFAEVPLLGRLITGSPSTPSIDFAGRVAALGPDSSSKNPSSSSSVPSLKVGQLIYGRLDGPTKFGALAEYTIAPRAGCTPVPAGVTLNDAAAVTSTGLTAYQSIIPKVTGKIGARVFINGGSGGVGTFAIQIAKNAGCHVTTSCSTSNVELCRALGADVVIDYRTQNLTEELQKLTKFDLVVDNVGAPADLYWQMPSFTKPDAPYVQVGTGKVTPGFVVGNLFKQFWPGWLGGGKRPWEFLGLVSKPEDYVQLSRWMEEGKLRSIIDEVFDMEDKGPIKAYEKLRMGRTKGKILVKVAEE